MPKRKDSHRQNTTLTPKPDTSAQQLLTPEPAPLQSMTECESHKLELAEVIHSLTEVSERILSVDSHLLQLNQLLKSLPDALKSLIQDFTAGFQTLQDSLKDFFNKNVFGFGTPTPVPTTPKAVSLSIKRRISTPLTTDEMARRRNNGLCFYCGATGHVISYCPVRPPKKSVPRSPPLNPELSNGQATERKSNCDSTSDSSGDELCMGSILHPQFDQPRTAPFKDSDSCEVLTCHPQNPSTMNPEILLPDPATFLSLCFPEEMSNYSTIEDDTDSDTGGTVLQTAVRSKGPLPPLPQTHLSKTYKPRTAQKPKISPDGALYTNSSPQNPLLESPSKKIIPSDCAYASDGTLVRIKDLELYENAKSAQRSSLRRGYCQGSAWN